MSEERKTDAKCCRQGCESFPLYTRAPPTGLGRTREELFAKRNCSSRPRAWRAACAWIARAARLECCSSGVALTGRIILSAFRTSWAMAWTATGRAADPHGGHGAIRPTPISRYPRKAAVPFPFRTVHRRRHRARACRVSARTCRLSYARNYVEVGWLGNTVVSIPGPCRVLAVPVSVFIQ